MPDFVFSPTNLAWTAAEIAIGMALIYLVTRSPRHRDAVFQSGNRAPARAVFGHRRPARRALRRRARLRTWACSAASCIAEATDMSCFEGACGYLRLLPRARRNASRRNRRRRAHGLAAEPAQSRSVACLKGPNALQIRVSAIAKDDRRSYIAVEIDQAKAVDDPLPVPADGDGCAGGRRHHGGARRDAHDRRFGTGADPAEHQLDHRLTRHIRRRASLRQPRRCIRWSGIRPSSSSSASRALRSLPVLPSCSTPSAAGRRDALAASRSRTDFSSGRACRRRQSRRKRCFS